MFFSRYFLQVIYTPLMHYKHWKKIRASKKNQNLGVDPLICLFPAAQQLPCCRAWDVLRWKDIGWTGEGPRAFQMVLPWFLVLYLDLRLKVRDVKLELKILVDYLLCNLIAWLPWNDNVSIKNKNISEVTGLLNFATWIYRFLVTWSFSYCALVTV